MDNKDNKKQKNQLGSFIQKIMKNMMQTEYNKKFRLDILKELRERVVPNKINTILNTPENNYISLYDTDIYWLAKFLKEKELVYGYYGYKDTKKFNEVIDVNQYFTSEEKNTAEMVLLTKETEKKSFQLEGVRRLADDMWMCDRFTYAKIKEGMDSGFLTYNFNTQREAQVYNNGIDIVKTPTVYNENIKEIKQLMISKSYEPNMVTINILATGEEEFSFNEEKGVFEFLTSANIADGYHRDEAAKAAYEEDPNLANDFLLLKITHYDVRKAQQRIILQESKGSRISTIKQKSLEPKKSIQVAKRINEYESKKINVMFDMISDNEDEVFKVETKYCLITAISEVIEETYGTYLDKPSDIGKITQYLVDFFNECASHFERDFFEVSIKESRSDSSILYNNMFSVLTYLAKILYKQSNWQTILEEFFNSHNFNINNTVWTDNLNIKATKYTKKHRSVMYTWVDEQVKKLLNNSEIAITR